MARIYLDCCKDEATADATEALRKAEGHTVLGRVENVDDIRRFVMETTTDASGVPVAFEKSKRVYYFPRDGHSDAKPPKIFVVSWD